MTDSTSGYVAFAAARRIAAGELCEVIPVLKQRFDRDPGEVVLLFEVETGRQLELDLRGSLEDALERYAPPPTRGPGRPRLGVSSREVSLFPRHWEWLEAQPSGISGALRRLVEQAIKHEPGKEKARRARDALSRFLTSMAGDRPHYEEVCRALFAGNTREVERLTERWPKDIREHVVQQMRKAQHAEREGATP